ncbi:NAD-dependent epimerase/dehydratase family protein [Brachybacterium sp. Marseille-Q7125]|uniref:polysaccharide biosynthesis C-terminal domain-containing protein n=1 Tax=Brachybacterium sp. Marseille-Q7125 TaxID=2932815 RepID=UPI001FF58C87
MKSTDTILITGAQGFLGWHLRVRLQALGIEDVLTVGRDDWDVVADRACDVDVVFHLAGINRDRDDVVENGNRELAERLRNVLAGSSPRSIVFADTIHADLDTPYGRGKSAAAEVLSRWADEIGAHFTDVRLPNLFGEHGRPFYNSFVATFVELAATGREPDIQDREVPLLHAQQAARALIDAVDGTGSRVAPQGTPILVSRVWEILSAQRDLYENNGTIPDLSDPLERDLFNTLRARLFVDRPAISLVKNTDPRGTFVETARASGGEGQTSFSTTVPGITRGNHYHLRKVERFVVLSGTARISIAKVFGTPDDRVELDVTGDEPVAVDMPTGWAHSITNTGDDVLITQFWISELYRPEDPDTVPHPV